MTQLPEQGTDSGYMSDARTAAEMQAALEDVYDVIAEIGSKAPTTRILSSNSFTDPASSMVLVASESGGSAPDDLDTIVPTNVTPGRYLLLMNSDTATTEGGADAHVTVKHNAGGTGEIYLNGAADFVLSGDRMILLILTSSLRWDEVYRYYGRKNLEDIIAERTFLGLSDVSLESMASTVSSTAGKILKVGSSDLSDGQALLVNSSGEIYGGPGSGDADTLEGILASSFVRTDSSSAQAIVGSVTVDRASGAATVGIDTADSSSTSGISMVHNGNERGSLFVDTASGDVELRSKSVGGANTSAVRLNPGTFTNTHTDASYTGSVEFNDAPGSGAWEHIRPGGGFGLDADMLDGVHSLEIIELISHIYDSTQDAEDSTATRGHIILGKDPDQIQIAWGGTLSEDSSSGETIYTRTFTREFSEIPVVNNLFLRLGVGAAVPPGGGFPQPAGVHLWFYPIVTTTHYRTRITSETSWTGITLSSKPLAPMIAIGRP